MFVHLRLHTEFSVVDGTNRIDETVKAAAGDHQPALAITDLNNLFGAIKFYKEARGAGVKPIIGAEILLQGLGKDAAVLSRMVVLVQNRQGYLNLCELLARAWTQNVVKAQAVCKLEWLRELGAGPDRALRRAGRPGGPGPGAGRCAARGRRGAGAGFDLSASLLHRAAARRPARRRGACGGRGAAGRAPEPAGGGHASGAVHAPRTTTRRTRRASASPKARSWATSGACASSRASSTSSRRPQMEQLFADLPSAMANTLEIAKRCNLVLELGKPQLPDYPTPNGMPIEEYFRFASHEGLKERLRAPLPRRGAARAGDAALRAAAGVRDRHHPEDGVPGLLPDRGRLHQLGQEQRLPGGAGPRLGRRLAGGLFAQDHRPRSAAIQPAVRALPEPRAGVDARLRHRLLPGQPRPRHRLRQGQVRQGRGEPDRDLRHHGRARGDPRRGPGAGHELHLLRRHQQADPQQAGPAHHDRRRASRPSRCWPSGWQKRGRGQDAARRWRRSSRA